MSVWLLLFGMISQPSACEMINGDQILGEDLARALPAFAAIPRDVVVAYSPAPSARRILTYPELVRIGARYGVATLRNASACFEWKDQLLTEDAVRAAVRETLQAPQARVDVLAINNTKAPLGQLVFPLSGLSASAVIDPATPVTWRGEVRYHGSHKFTVWARVRVSATMTRVVATELLLPGQTLAAKQVRIETYDDFPLRNDVARALEEVVGRVARRAIRTGLPVFRTDLMEPLQIQRGDTVQVTSIFGAAQIQMEASAESSGRQGDIISLKNPHSGKVFRARIEGKDKAIVIPGTVALLPRAQ
jgi:flagella basal body P-ring formation protein FlgA